MRRIYVAQLRTVEDEVHNRLIEVVAAQTLDSLADHDFVHVPRHFQQRGVEGAAAEVVDEDVLAFGRDGGAVPVGVFEARGRRFIQQRDDMETRRYESIQRQKALGARGIGRHADRGLDGFTRRKARRSSDAEGRFSAEPESR